MVRDLAEAAEAIALAVRGAAKTGQPNGASVAVARACVRISS